MALTETEKQHVANFTNDLEVAIVGLQLHNIELPTITASQYACMLASSMYATQQMQARGEALPSEDRGANFEDFFNYAAEHYAETLTNVAIQKAKDTLAAAGLPELPDLGVPNLVLGEP